LWALGFVWNGAIRPEAGLMWRQSLVSGQTVSDWRDVGMSRLSRALVRLVPRSPGAYWATLGVALVCWSWVLFSVVG
jgi:hypothetical protein